MSLVHLPYRKYPEISCVEEREKYRAVFNDQYQEYKELHADISSTLDKFSELDGVMTRLLKDGRVQGVSRSSIIDVLMNKLFQETEQTDRRVILMSSGWAEDPKHHEEISAEKECK